MYDLGVESMETIRVVQATAMLMSAMSITYQSTSKPTVCIS